MKRRQKWFRIGWWGGVASLGCGFGLGVCYHNSNLTVYLGPLALDLDVPTRTWLAIVRDQAIVAAEKVNVWTAGGHDDARGQD